MTFNIFNLVKNLDQKGSIIKWVVIIIAIILVLSYFNVNIEQFLKKPIVRDNFGFVTNKILYVWQNFLQKPVRAAYRFFVYYIWEPLIDGLERMRNEQPAFDIKDKVPKLLEIPKATTTQAAQ